MARDITYAFVSGSHHSNDWDSGAVLKVLSMISNSAKGSRIDWDQKAGEAWGVVLTKTESISFVCAVVPVMFCRKDLLSISVVNAMKHEGVVVPCNDFSLKEMTAEEDVIAKVFGLDGIDGHLLDELFSVNDLYYATV